MTRIEVKEWNGQFSNKGVLTTIRRKIQGGQMSGTILVDLEGAVLTPEQLAALKKGWLDYKVKFCGSVASLPHPLPENVSVKGLTDRSPTGGASATNRTQTDPAEGHKPGNEAR